ncbi:Serine/threonine-protein phosphatase PGAM5, mitochondrial [Orchesella cincta]|uniref:Serine/threonine-protein phosphatase PGAM5, mitochondrial n=1 Tax=Orchesella cincta TaxID=48709 RepID=A0A1D2MWQ2_ORCCI|nr:Serine/threonine-protein phosphatase PGAM5, mitochondrial [Orchesella cincta]
MHQRMRFLKYWKWVGGAAAAASVTVVVANYSTTWHPQRTLPPGPLPSRVMREPYSLLKPPKRTKSKSADGSGDKEDDIVEQLEKRRAKATRHIFLIRHGQYNLDGETDKERVLTELGEKQAGYAGRRLKDSGIDFTSFTVSNMTRALQTSDIIFKELNQQGLCIGANDPILREGSPCLPEPEVGRRLDVYYYEDGPRIEAAFRKYFHRADPDQEKDSYEIIVCHANVIRYFVCRALQFPGEAWLRISLKNCSLSVLSILPSGRVILRALGDAGHMPADLHTTT